MELHPHPPVVLGGGDVGDLTPKWTDLAEALAGDEIANLIFSSLLVELADAATGSYSSAPKVSGLQQETS